MADLKLSLIIVTKDRPLMLERLLKSIINGASLPNEVIIVDNSLTKSAEEVTHKAIEQYPQVKIKFYHEKAPGISNARNAGLKNSQYDIVAFTDDDCIVDQHWVKSLLHYHGNFPDAIAVGGKTQNIEAGIIGYTGHLFRKFVTLSDIISDEKIKYSNADDYLEKKHYMKSLATQNISYKKEKIASLEFNSMLKASEAVDFSWRILKNWPKGIHYDPGIIVHHEYRNNFGDFLKQCIQYGRSSSQLHRFAKKGRYLPEMKLSATFLDSVFFSLNESLRNNLSFFSKILLFKLLVLRSILFNIARLTSFGDPK